MFVLRGRASARPLCISNSFNVFDVRGLQAIHKNRYLRSKQVANVQIFQKAAFSVSMTNARQAQPILFDLLL